MILEAKLETSQEQNLALVNWNEFAPIIEAEFMRWQIGSRMRDDRRLHSSIRGRHFRSLKRSQLTFNLFETTEEKLDDWDSSPAYERCGFLLHRQKCRYGSDRLIVARRRFLRVSKEGDLVETVRIHSTRPPQVFEELAYKHILKYLNAERGVCAIRLLRDRRPEFGTSRGSHWTLVIEAETKHAIDEIRKCFLSRTVLLACGADDVDFFGTFRLHEAISAGDFEDLP